MVDFIINAAGAGTIKPFAGTPLFELATSPTDYITIEEIEIEMDTGSGATISIGLGVPAVAGSLLRGAFSLLGLDGGTATLPNLTFATQWGRSPTAPPKFFRRSAAIEFTNLIWYFPRGMKLAPSTSLVAWVASGAALPNAGIFVYNIKGAG